MKKAISSIIITGLLQFFFFGAGYLRLKQWKRFAVSWFVTLTVFLLIPIIFPPRSFPFSAPIWLLLIVALSAIFSIDVMRLRYRHNEQDDVQLLSWWKIVIFILVLEIATTMVKAVATPNMPSWIGSSSFQVKTIGMSPALEKYEYIIVDNWAYKNSTPTIGDVVTATDGSTGKTVVARLRKVDSSEALLTRDNGAWIAEPELTVPIGAIQGKVVSIWFSTDLSRIGKIVK